MKFSWMGQLEKRQKADALVLPLWKGQGELAYTIPSALLSQISGALETGDFKGNEGEVLCLYVTDLPEKRILLLGLGLKDKLTVESLRICYSSLVKSCRGRRLKILNLLVPQINTFSQEALIRGIAEGLLLSNYSIEQFKQKEEEETESFPGLIEKVTWISPLGKSLLPIAKKAQVICEGVYYTRHLVNGNADKVTPQYLENCAREMQKTYPQLKLTLFDRKRLEKEKMGLLLAVNRGSMLDPAFIILEYRGNPKSGDHTVIVGKGVTYDTGGLNLKIASMEFMKCDMGGAAVCLGTLLAICQLGLKVNVTIVIPSTENAIDARSFKPGDIYQGYSGKTVEVINTDAEGRLILADALAYAVQNLKPTRLIDFATLTGAIDIALGPEASGLMSNDEALTHAIEEAAKETAERVWQMPLYEEYREKLKSDIADLKNWNGRSASSCVAAIFLKEFVGNVPWAHIDIASTAYFSDPKKYWPKYATGIGVRLMVDLLEKISNSG